jgi:hypothetical protein
MVISKSIVGPAMLFFVLNSTAFTTTTLPKRIRFQRGGSSATVSGTLTKAHLQESFVVGARSGQTLHIRATAQSNTELNFVNFVVSSPSHKVVGADDNAGAAAVRLSQSGDYQIDVSPPGVIYRGSSKNYVRFTLFVSIE